MLIGVTSVQRIHSIYNYVCVGMNVTYTWFQEVVGADWGVQSEGDEVLSHGCSGYWGERLKELG